MLTVAGQLNEAERASLTEGILQAPVKPKVVLEVGTWLGGGSTLHILRALEANGEGHLWGVEADQAICNPIEIAASILPSNVCAVLLDLLPRKIAHRLSDGVN